MDWIIREPIKSSQKLFRPRKIFSLVNPEAAREYLVRGVTNQGRLTRNIIKRTSHPFFFLSFFLLPGMWGVNYLSDVAR